MMLIFQKFSGVLAVCDSQICVLGLLHPSRVGSCSLCEVIQETQNILHKIPSLKLFRILCLEEKLLQHCWRQVWFVPHGKGLLRDCCSLKQHKNMMLLCRCAQHRGQYFQKILFCHLGFLNSLGVFVGIICCPEHLFIFHQSIPTT